MEINKLLKEAKQAGKTALNESESKQFLKAFGIPVVSETVVFNKEDALFFIAEGIPLAQAMRMSKKNGSKKKLTTSSKKNAKANDNWKESGFKTKDAKYYIKTNTSISDAKKWKKAGFKGKDAYYYINKNISLKEAIARLK